MKGGLVASAVVVVLLLVAPIFSPAIHVDISILSECLLMGIAAMSVNLMLGYTGMLAFGNAAFFGLGAYGAGLSIKFFNAHFIQATIIGVLAAVVGALIIGPFLLRRRGIYFALLMVAFGQVFYFIAYRFTDVTGGEDGMNFSRPYFGFSAWHFTLKETAFYYVMLAIFLVVMLGMWYLTRSPFGRTLVAIRQNEVRVRYLGLNSDRFIFIALLISALMAGLAGALYSLLIMFAFPLMLDWHQSGDFVLMVILGGAGTLWGPLIGAIVYVVGKDIISTITPAWEIFLGGLFVACVLAFPKGLLGTALDLVGKRRAPVDDGPVVGSLESSQAK